MTLATPSKFRKARLPQASGLTERRLTTEEARLPRQKYFRQLVRIPGDLRQLRAVGDKRRLNRQLLRYTIPIRLDPILKLNFSLRQGHVIRISSRPPRQGFRIPLETRMQRRRQRRRFEGARAEKCGAEQSCVLDGALLLGLQHMHPLQIILEDVGRARGVAHFVAPLLVRDLDVPAPVGDLHQNLGDAVHRPADLERREQRDGKHH